MRSYKGIIQLACTLKRDEPCTRGVKVNVVPTCMDCPKSETNVVDLNGRSKFRFTPKAAKKKSTTKKKPASKSKSKK